MTFTPWRSRDVTLKQPFCQSSTINCCAKRIWYNPNRLIDFRSHTSKSRYDHVIRRGCWVIDFHFSCRKPLWIFQSTSRAWCNPTQLGRRTPRDMWYAAVIQRWTRINWNPPKYNWMEDVIGFPVKGIGISINSQYKTYKLEQMMQQSLHETIWLG